MDQALSRVCRDCSFKLIARVEAEHERRCLRLLRNVEEGRVLGKPAKVRWTCRNCAYVYEGEKAPEKCPACLHLQAFCEVDA